jgi:GT2 family glycosyltransferase
MIANDIKTKGNLNADRALEGILSTLANCAADTPEAVEAISSAILPGASTDPYGIPLSKTALNLSAGDYARLVLKIRAAVERTVPAGSILAVVSKGDPQLLEFKRRTGWHFARDSKGNYAGYHPVCSASAVAQLEAARAFGAQYLVIPSTAYWWFDHYRSFSGHLARRYRLVRCLQDVCAIYSLHERATPTLAAQLQDTVAEFKRRFGFEPTILDWNSGGQLKDLVPEATVFSPPQARAHLPYVDRSIDLVAISTSDPTLIKEARRVSKFALLNLERAKGQNLLKTEWLRLPRRQEQTSVSIIIPCYNGSSVTEACLRSLCGTLPIEFKTEIVLVDDASSDDTPATLDRWRNRDERVRVVRNRKNLGFVGACNRGAREAAGDILVFLNNDTVLLPGWLPPLVNTFQDFPDAGAVGGKLVYPDGTLQEAGGVVFSDGTAMNFGRADADLDEPLYNFVREADYCSAALLATKRVLFSRLGGFDARYAPGYYEDTDYCFRVRGAGHRVLYQPESAVVHQEGASAGTDLAKGMKASQKTNQAKFAKRWKRALKTHPARPSKVTRGRLEELAFRGVMAASR